MIPSLGGRTAILQVFASAVIEVSLHFMSVTLAKAAQRIGGASRTMLRSCEPWRASRKVPRLWLVLRVPLRGAFWDCERAYRSRAAANRPVGSIYLSRHR